MTQMITTSTLLQSLWRNSIIDLSGRLVRFVHRATFLILFYRIESIDNIENKLPTRQWELFHNEMKKMRQHLSESNTQLQANDPIKETILSYYIIAWNTHYRS